MRQLCFKKCPHTTTYTRYIPLYFPHSTADAYFGLARTTVITLFTMDCLCVLLILTADAHSHWKCQVISPSLWNIRLSTITNDSLSAHTLWVQVPLIFDWLPHCCSFPELGPLTQTDLSASLSEVTHNTTKRTNRIGDLTRYRVSWGCPLMVPLRFHMLSIDYQNSSNPEDKGYQ